MAAVGENWKCPYCGHAQVLDKKRFDQDWHRMAVEGEKSERSLSLGVVAIVCANSECRELSLCVQLAVKDARGDAIALPREEWTLLPASPARPLPSSIPKPIRDDYYEASAIRDLSPSAAAAIARRCLQRMFSDFCGISGRRLADAIDELRARVAAGTAPPGIAPDTLDAIESVRNIGNIGAHMAADSNVIVDVDPDEAQTLIELVEVLLSEWYIATQARNTSVPVT
jgi:Domain of unknown function (DUF4145)